MYKIYVIYIYIYNIINFHANKTDICNTRDVFFYICTSVYIYQVGVYLYLVAFILRASTLILSCFNNRIVRTVDKNK